MMLESPNTEDMGGLSGRLASIRTLVCEVGREALAFRNRAGTDVAKLGVGTKGPQDFVTMVDKRAEQAIRAGLAIAFPDDGFLGEETGGSDSTQSLWVVDPIDGTSNYIRGLRHWGVSAAYVAGGHVLIGAIYDAANDRVYSAVRGGGAFRDNVAIHASSATDPAISLCIVGYSRRTSFDDYQAMTRRLYEIGFEYRRIGSAAIGLARVADGVADLYYERHLNSWDVLAGALIAREAGAVVHMPALQDILKRGGPILACAPALDEKVAFLRGEATA